MKGKVNKRIFDFKGLRPSAGDILVIKKWKGFTDRDQREIMKALEENLTEDVTIFFVRNISDIKLLSEKKLNAYGLGKLPD